MVHTSHPAAYLSKTDSGIPDVCICYVCNITMQSLKKVTLTFYLSIPVVRESCMIALWLILILVYNIHIHIYYPFQNSIPWNSTLKFNLTLLAPSYVQNSKHISTQMHIQYKYSTHTSALYLAKSVCAFSMHYHLGLH